MEFMASVLKCDSGAIIRRYCFGKSLNGTRIPLPFVQESPYIVKQDCETGIIGIVAFDPGVLKWEPAVKGVETCRIQE